MDNKEIDEKQEDMLIESKFQELLQGYINSNHRKKIEIIERAYKFAKEAHKGIRRRSGEPYILHPIAVARIASQEIGLGSTSICAALLHDVVEDTEYTVEDIENHFGKKIASLVSGLTKISGGIFGDRASAQAENFRKLLLTMAEDIRVVLIKMADRLHNMRTLGSMLPSKQYKIAGETLYIYAPLAHRLGLFAIKTELEDLSFKYEHPDAYKEINEKILATDANRQAIYTDFAIPIKKKMEEMGLTFSVKARIKSVYSIWNKMVTKKIPFEEVYDLYAVRIVFECDNEADEKRLCWNIYSCITDLYELHPERTRDWVSRPKANGYRALHVTVMGPDGNWIEVQIRSRRMDEIAERGFAAHWKYKIGDSEEEKELDTWLKTIKDILEHPEPNAIDFLDTIKLNLFASEIFVFTPKGDLKTLPKDATVLDMAFTLHSQLGMQCIAGKVNHKLVPLNTKLQSGDQVEILTSKSQTPKPEWVDFVTTAKAKTRLLAVLRKDRKTVALRGEEKFRDFLMNIDVEFNNETVTKVMSNYRVATREELFYLIGNGEVTLSDNIFHNDNSSNTSVGIFQKLLNFGSLGNKSKDKTAIIEENTVKKIDRKATYLLRDVDGVKNYKIAACCHPIPGDDVLGYVENDETVVVHKRNCPTAMKLKSSYGPRLVSTQWDTSIQTDDFITSILIKGIDRVGIMNELTKIISYDMNINIRYMEISTDNGLFIGKLRIMVHDSGSVEHLCEKLKCVPGVKSAVRGDDDTVL